tara:strand:- start:137 stop:241 length:105 start_codon:yes stop_codon:yes gene_type:complete
MFLVVALDVKVMGLVKVQLDHVLRLKDYPDLNKT